MDDLELKLPGEQKDEHGFTPSQSLMSQTINTIINKTFINHLN